MKAANIFKNKIIWVALLMICSVIGANVFIYLHRQSQKIVLGYDMKEAAVYMAMAFDDFDSDKIADDKTWKEYFIKTFIQNSRFSCKYMTEISKKNNGIISVKDINYMQKSLTGKDIDFSDIAGNGIDSNASSSGLNRGILESYDSDPVVDGGVLKGIVAIESEPIGEGNIVEKRKISAYLVKNPDSCFDGYSVRTIHSEKMLSEKK